MSRHCLPRLLAITILAATGGLPVSAQTAPAAPPPAVTPSDTGTQAPPPAAATAETRAAAADPGDCPPEAAKAEAATPEGGANDATAPSNSGSTGWTGGTGGSMIGTNPSGAVRTTKTWHAPTARGLDLRGRPEPAPAC